jgi:hypothetical protein
LPVGSALFLHLHPGHNPLQTTGRKFVELYEVRRQLLDEAEDLPDQVPGIYVFYPVENHLFLDSVAYLVPHEIMVKNGSRIIFLTVSILFSLFIPGKK